MPVRNAERPPQLSTWFCIPVLTNKSLKMVQYTFNYFDVRGLGESVRLLFKYAGVDFKDNRITHADWPKVKPTTPTGKLPYLEVDGKILPESGAILRYLARQFKLTGANEFEAAFADSTVDTYRDFQNAIRPYFIVAAGFGEGDLAQLYKDVYVPNRDISLKHVVDIISKTKSGFIVDSGVTWADFFITEHITTLLNFDNELEKKFPQLVAYQKKVYAVPQIKSYIESRNTSKF